MGEPTTRPEGDRREDPDRDRSDPEVADLEADLQALTRAYQVLARRLAAAERALADRDVERARRLMVPVWRLARRLRRAGRSASKLFRRT